MSIKKEVVGLTKIVFQSLDVDKYVLIALSVIEKEGEKKFRRKIKQFGVHPELAWVQKAICSYPSS